LIQRRYQKSYNHMRNLSGHLQPPSAAPRAGKLVPCVKIFCSSMRDKERAVLGTPQPCVNWGLEVEGQMEFYWSPCMTKIGRE
jgi:hypothetical protein